MKRKLSMCLAIVFILASITTSIYANHSASDDLVLTRFDIGTQTKSTIRVPSKIVSTNKTSVASTLFAPREIIGYDTRSKVSNPLAFPYYATVQIITFFSNETKKQGTGFMISEDVLLTAGHCITSSDPNATVTSMMVYAGKSGNSYTVSSSVDTFYTDTKYEGPTSGDYDWDYGIVVLDEAIGNTTGWLGLHYGSSSDLKSGTIFVTGYPLETLDDDAYPTMYISSGSVSRVRTYRFTHDADTSEGQSGSPVYKYIEDYGYVAVGIHVAGGNTARRITETLYNWLGDEGYIS